MDFGWSDEQLAYRRAVVEFARAELNDGVIERDSRHEFSSEQWKRCAAFGIQGLPVPEEFGGQGADPLTISLALEALGYGCTDNGLIFALNAQMWSCELPLVKFGTQGQKQKYLPALCDGSQIGVQAMTEPATGSDAFALRTTAQRVAGGYLINGTKTFISNASVADIFLVFATVDPTKGVAGISALIVERGTKGLHVGQPFRKMGLRTADLSELSFENCFVPEDNLLASEGAGLAIFNTSMDWERTFILAGAIGTMERQLERSVEYARERTQFGKPIGSYQAVSHRLVDMRVHLEAARLLLYKSAWKKSVGQRTTVDSAITKLFISEAFLESSLAAMQTHGGYGYIEEFELERDVRDAIAGRIYSGTSDIQKNIVAGGMGL